MSIRIFIGAAASGEDAESLSVLTWTALKLSSEPVEFVYMMQSHDPASFWHGWATERWATPFSGFRWGIPAYCGFEGRAIYTDSDVWFQDDPAKLFNQPMQGVVALKKPGSWRFCVSLWDCAAAKSHLWPIERLKADPDAHRAMGAVFRNPALTGDFSGNWNCLDGENYASLDDPDIKAVHYTDMGTQPQLRHALPRLAAAGQAHWFDGKLREHKRPDVVARFDELLAEAKAHDLGPEHFIPEVPFGSYRKQSLTHYRGNRA